MFRRIKKYFAPLQSSKDDNRFNFGPTLEQYSTQRYQTAQTYIVSRHSRDDPIPSNDEVEKINRDLMEQAKLAQAYKGLAQSREALDLTLKSQHRLLIATLITALVALVVGIISLFNKPPVVNIAPPVVNVQPPTVNVQPPDVNVNVTPQQ